MYRFSIPAPTAWPRQFWLSTTKEKVTIKRAEEEVALKREKEEEEPFWLPTEEVQGTKKPLNPSTIQKTKP